MILVGLKLLSNEVIAKICCRLKFSATMASRFVEANKEFIEELRNTSEIKNTKRSTDYWTNIFQQWTKTRGKNEQLESYEVPELRDRSLITSRGGAVVLEGGGYNFKTSPFLEDKFFTGKKHEGGQIL